MFQECRHIMPSGSRCHAAALRDMPYCYFHSSLHRSTAPKGKFDDQSLRLPTLEDSSAVQIALSQVLSALGSSQLDSRRAGLLLYGLQIAAQITARPSLLKPSDSVRSVCHQGDGDVLAPENTVCEPPADCPNCLKRDTCINPLRPFDELDEVLLEQEEEMMRMRQPL